MGSEFSRRGALQIGAGTFLAGVLAAALPANAYAATAGRPAAMPAQAASVMDPPFMATRAFGTVRTTDWSSVPIRFAYTGVHRRRYPDASKQNAPTYAKVHVFVATWLKSTTEVLVSAKLSRLAAESRARSHVFALGRAPHFLRREVAEMRIYTGAHSATSLNGVISIYEGATYPKHRWPNVYVHEAAHCLNEKLRKSQSLLVRWEAAVAADRRRPNAPLKGFISEYAYDKPNGEDFGESLISWLAVRFHAERLADQAPGAYEFIHAQIPHRLRFFDARNWDTAPLR